MWEDGMGRRSKNGGTGTPGDFSLYPNRMAFNPEPPPKQKYFEAILGRRRGRVVKDMGDSLVVELYATGDHETVSKADVKLEERHP